MSLSTLASAAPEATVAPQSCPPSRHVATPGVVSASGQAPESLVTRAVSGDAAAWQALQAWAYPLLERWARSHPSMRRRRLHYLVDDVQEIATATLERLRADGFANLKKYSALRASDPQATIDAWLYGAMDFAVREHLRARFGRVRAAASEDAPTAQVSSLHKRELHTLAPRLREDIVAMPRDALTARLTWRQIMDYAQRCFAEPEARAIQHYIEQDASYEELAAALGLGSADAAERLIRKLKERLRAHFRSI